MAVFQIAKLRCYGPDKINLKLILNYLSHHKQRTKMNYPSVLGVTYTLASHRAQYLRRFFLNIFFIDLFLNVVKSEVRTFADDNTS